MNNSFITYFRKKILIIFLFSIVSIVVFVLFSTVFSDKYKVELFGYSTIFETSHNKSNINVINSLISENNFDLLAKEMNLEKEIVQDLRKIDYFDLISKEKIHFKMLVVSRTNNHFEDYTKGLVYFFNNYGRSKALYEAEKTKLNSLILFKTNEIEIIENSIKNVKGFELDSDLFIGKNELKNELEDIKLDLLNVNGLNFLNNPIVPTNAYFPNQRLFGIIGFVLGFLFVFIFYLIKYELKKSK
tara:strand:+ start:1881 stop:2612 length:732 start_codon:yes stop_codon:yes gene_type:complete